MKITRRGFIGLVAGAAAGINLTPLPWKLIDDSAIWTQNWPWVPKVTRFPNVEYQNTVCTLCPGGCGVKVKMINNQRTVKVEGQPSAPVNQGGVCPIGAAGPQYQYGLARFYSPLKRMGARGSGAYTKLSWSAAFKEVGGKLKELRDKGQAHTVVMISGRRNTLSRALAGYFMAAYGSPNLIQMPCLELSQGLAQRVQFGWENALGYDLENSDFILSFGSALIEGWGAPVRSIQVFSDSRQANGAKLVQVDSRAGLTASKADQWVAAAPGSEAALALGMANVMIRENLYDKAFVDSYTFGFDIFKQLVLKEYTLDNVAAITGLKNEEIELLARTFAKAKAPLAIAGKGTGAMPTPVYELMAVMSLNALKGNINKKGGVIIRKDLPLGEWPEPALDEAAQKGLTAPRLDLAGSPKYPLTDSLIQNLVESIESNRLYPVNMLILDQANPAYFGSYAAEFRAAMAKIPTVVSLSSSADDTSAFADIILPQSANFEAPADVLNPPSLPYPLFGFGKKILDQSPYDTKPIGDIYIGLAKAVGGSVKEAMPFASHDKMIAQSAAGLFASGRGVVAEADGEAPGGVFGMDDNSSFKDEKEFQKALAKGNFWYDGSFEFGKLDDAFQTPSSKFEFLSQTLQEALFEFLALKGAQAGLAELGLTAPGAQLFLPHFEPYVPEDQGGNFPLLLAPMEQFKLVTSHIGNAPYLTKLAEDTTLKSNDLVVEIHPHTAEGLHLHEGDMAWLSTPKGRIQVRVHLFDGARPDVVYAPIGLGHRGFGYYLRNKGSNPMEIMETTTDPLSGQALWWGTKANLTKV
jgi:anaerobic selenocysteine-containing dehydrogenase